MLIFLFGAGALSYYQVVMLEDRWEQVTQTIDKMDTQVKRGQYEKAKFFAIARDILLLAPKDPNANDVAVFYKLKQLQEARPELMALNTTGDSSLTNTPDTATNSSATNAAPAPAPAPSTK